MSSKLSKKDKLTIAKYVRKVNSLRNSICPICYDRNCDSYTTCHLATQKGQIHLYHIACIESWKYTQLANEHIFTCPTCRAGEDKQIDIKMLLPEERKLFSYKDLMKALEIMDNYPFEKFKNGILSDGLEAELLKTFDGNWVTLVQESFDT